MQKIFGYVRESTMQQAMHGYNIEEQKRVIEDYCKYHFKDYELEIFVEKGKSATSMNRPELQNLLDKARKAKANKVIFHSLDRLTRDIADLYWLINYFDKHQIELVSVMESFDLTSAIGRSHVYNSGVYAQLESERTSERTIRAIKQAVIEKKYPFSHAPLGYDKIDKKLYPSKDENQIKIVKYIFDTFAENRHNYREVRNEVKKRFDYKMDDQAIVKTLRRRLYTGTMEYRGVVVEDYCEPLIDQKTFDEANENSKIVKRPYRRAMYLFQNLVVCADCDSRMSHTCGTGRHKKVYEYYRCKVCGHRASQDMILEKKAYQLQSLANEYYRDNSGYKEKRKQIALMRKNQKKLVEMQKGQGIDVETFYELFLNYENEINALSKELDNIERKELYFDDLEKSLQKEIIHKYVKLIRVHFKNQGYKITVELIRK